MSALPIPSVALEDCGAILGRRGAGKSATKQLFFEHELDAGHRCCLIDPKGDSWGIRLNPDGLPSRFQQVVIFGGPHGDVALTESMGEEVGRLIATHDLSCIVDLSGFTTLASMRRFMRDLSWSLFQNNRQPLTLFVDEADQLAPQNVPGEMAQLLHNMEALIRQGRQRGIFMWMMTQRPAVLNKNLLSQAETLVAMKMTTKHDLDAMQSWLDAHDPAKAKEVRAKLAHLSVGEAFVWVPGEGFLERVQFPLFSTFDSGRTPKHGERIDGVTLPPIDLGAISAALAKPDLVIDATDEGAKVKPLSVEQRRDGQTIVTLRAEDMQAFAAAQAEIAALRAQLAEAVSRANRAEGTIDILGGIARAIQTDATKLLERLERDNEIPAQGGGVPEVDNGKTEGPADVSPRSAPRAAARPSAAQTAIAKPPGGGNASSGALSSSLLRVINAIAWWNSFGLGAPTANQVGFIAGYAPTGGTFKKYRGELRTRGLVDYPSDGRLSLTNAGRAEATHPDTEPTIGALHRAVYNNIGGALSKVLSIIIDAYPAPISAAAVGELAGYEASGGTFKKYRGQLKTLELVEYPAAGMLRAADWLFAEVEA